MTKIFLNNKPLFLTATVDRNLTLLLTQPDTLVFKETDGIGIPELLDQLHTNSNTAAVYLHSKPHEVLQNIKSNFVVIQAAGGLVYTKNGELLLIRRRGKWDLPKGKLDEGEDLAACALREIAEETGATSLTIIAPLTVTYHTYEERKQQILKESHWYLTEAPEAMSLSPQTEEDIEECLWVESKNITDFYPEMHASIIDVITAGLNKLGR